MDKGVLKHRRLIQAAAAFLTNANLPGFFQGKIYKGPLKHICVPGLNCYSCPGAVGSCPIGAMQAVLNSQKYRFSFYIVGFLCMLGVLFGRFICGFLCVFGLIQDLLYKIPLPKLTVPKKLDRRLRYAKYAVLLLFVMILPAFLVNQFGMGSPWFCKLVCPAGTLEGGVLLTLFNAPLRKSIGFLFAWKFTLMAVILTASIFIYRPFCKYICPLGAFYALFNKVSFIRIHLDTDKCTDCGVCEKKCKMGVDVRKKPDSAECIRCGDCIKACPFQALHMGAVSPNHSVSTRSKLASPPK